MFDFGEADEAKIEAIKTTDGPLLIIAGPGTGKTYTLVQRVVYLIQECNVEPNQILVSTFTEKAAKELVTRISNELLKREITANVNEMYIGTFHSLCLRILTEHLEYSRLKRNHRMLEDFDQKYFVYQNMNSFRSLEGFDLLFPKGKIWDWADRICFYVNNLSEELVDVNELIHDENPEIVLLGNILRVYHDMLASENAIDFSGLQTECYNLLLQNPTVLEELQNQIKYLMIDEYQDTNYIQEQLVLLLGKKHNNICVVGDDDQGLYRFRGATIRNILQFGENFPQGECKVVRLVTNYRSDSDIVDFYNKWMSTTSGKKFKFDWTKFRYDKKIVAHAPKSIKSPAVVKLSCQGSDEEWYECIYNFIDSLKDSGKLTDNNQMAFLFNSVKNQKVIGLANYLEGKGVNVYSPRSEMFFQRYEIRLIIGCMLVMFPNYVSDLEDGKYPYLSPKLVEYYLCCARMAVDFMKNQENNELRKFIQIHGNEHMGLTRNTDYGYSGLIYQLFMFKPFSEILDMDMDVGVVDIRPARNLALFTQIIVKYENLHGVNVLTKKGIDKDTERLFTQYLRFMYDGGINEYEDDSEYAPSGCVSFMTIHQSKGMEFPIVFIDSLGNGPRDSHDDLLREIEKKYFHRDPFEPYDDIKYFDFWRLFYTAFSRPQNLLILTCCEGSKSPSKYFSEVYNDLKSIDDPEFDLNEFEFDTVKDVNIKDAFSFTSHISVYETCALQYKFFKELDFMPVRQGSVVFGTLVHETIEDMHRAAMKGEKDQITRDNIQNWFDSNCASLEKSSNMFLGESQKTIAFDQVLRYAERMKNKWDSVKEAEVDVSLVQKDYIIEGKIDLIQGEGDTVEIVDFKSDHKPDMVNDKDRIEKYRRQLHLYAYLVEQRTGHKVSRMNLYYTAEENGNPIISFPYTSTAIEGTVAAFDDTVQKILKKDFSHCAENQITCNNCDFRFYCGKK